MLAALIQIDGYDPVAGAAVTLRAASHDDLRLCMLNGQIWWPAIEKLPTLRYDLFDGDFGGQITAPTGSMSIATEPWPSFGRYALADARFRLWTAELGDPWASFTLRFDGRITTQPKSVDAIAQLAVAVDDRWLDTALLPTYAGTTGAEGPAAMKGQVKPLAIGAPRYVAGTLIDPINSVFQLSLGAINDVEAALERLARFAAPVANYASYAALVAATIAPGTWATAKAVGMARFGAPPTGQVSFLVQGDAAGTEGWVRTPGKFIRRIALLSGGAGKISDASLNSLDTARPYNISTYLDQQTTARDLIQRIAASLNCVAGVNFLGKLFVVPVAIGTPAWTLAADGSALPPVTSVEQVEVDAPFKALALQGERTWTVHPYSEIAFTAEIVDRGTYDNAVTYREGNIVAVANGIRYLYTATTPSAGNAPPNGTYWTVFEGSTRNTVTRAGTAPASPTDGDIWVDTSVTPNVTKYRISGSWALGANLVTQGTDIGVENGSTGSDNQIVNSALTTDTAGWVLSGVTRLTGGSGTPTPGFFTHPAGVTAAYANNNVAKPLSGAKRLHISGNAYADVGLTGTMKAVIYWYNAGGTFLSQSDVSILPPGFSGWYIGLGGYVDAPAAASSWRAFFDVNTSGAACYTGALRVAATEPAADVTKNNQVVIEFPTLINVPASYTGVVDPSLYNIEFTPKVTIGGVDMRTSDRVTYSYTGTSQTGSIDNTTGSSTKGKVSISALNANETKSTVVVTVDGIAQPANITNVNKQNAAAPTGGGAGGGAIGKTASDSTFNSVSDTTFVAISDIMTVALAPGERLVGTAPLDYNVTGSTLATRTASAKWRYAVSGTAPTNDFAAAITGSTATSRYTSSGEIMAPEPGHGDFNQAKTGLSAGNYDVQLFAATNASGRTVNFTGTATIEAKP